MKELKNIEFHNFPVSNETIRATKQEQFFTEVATVQSITDIVLLSFSSILLPRTFMSCYAIIHFFVNNFFFKCLYFSGYDIRMFIFVLFVPMFLFVLICFICICLICLICIRMFLFVRNNEGNRGRSFKMFTDAHRGRGVSRFMFFHVFHVFMFYIDIYRQCFILLLLLLLLLLNVFALAVS